MDRNKQKELTLAFGSVKSKYRQVKSHMHTNHLRLHTTESEQTNRTRITACGNLITDYPGNVSTDTAALETIKLHWNSAMLTPGARYMTIDISNMHLNTPLDCYEHMQFYWKDIPPGVVEEYNLNELADANGYCEHIFNLNKNAEINNMAHFWYAERKTH